MPGFFTRLLSHGADRQLKELRGITARVGELEPKFSALSDDELARQTTLFRERYDNGESLDDMLPEAFAAVREASRRANMSLSLS
jgi:preprotein translocase subunit SecA